MEPERVDACASVESCACAGTRRACTTNRDVWPDFSDPFDYLGHQLGRGEDTLGNTHAHRGVGQDV